MLANSHLEPSRLPLPPTDPHAAERAAVSESRHGFAFDELLFPGAEQHSKRPVWVRHIFQVGDSDRDRLAVGSGDLLESRAAIEGAAFALTNLEPHGVTDRSEVEHRSQEIGAILLAQPALEPETPVGAADAWTARVDRAARAFRTARPQFRAGRAGELR